MIVLTADQQVRFAVSYKDKYGNDATIDGAPVWTSSNPAFLTVTPADDGMSCLAVTVGPTGTAQVVVRADGDLGDGAREILGVEDVEIIGGEAMLATLSSGAVEAKPAADVPPPDDGPTPTP